MNEATPQPPPHRRATLHTIGCRLNQAETAVLSDRLKRKGYDLVAFGQPTDLLVLNTCSVTDHAESDCRYLIRRTLRHSPQAFVAVTGCYAQTGAEALRRETGVDLIVGARHKMFLPDLLPDPAGLRKRPAPQILHTRRIDRDDFVIEGTGAYETARANVKVQDGCNFMCSFCIIPFARGHERSRALDDVVREARELADRGHREVVLTGVNIGRYRQAGRSLLELIQRLESIPDIARIRISSIEPTTIPEALLDHMADSAKLCRYLHVPLQSGDDGVLAAMNRRYTVKEYVAFIEQAVRRIPELGLGTDVMVGFPGEGDREFRNTLSLVNALPFSYCHVFSFSERPGTPAARMHDTVHPATMKARSRALADLSRAKRLAFSQRYLGRTLPVLFEARDSCGLWTGLTENFIRVGVPAGDDLTNVMRDVELTGVMDGLATGRLTDPAARNREVLCLDSR